MSVDQPPPGLQRLMTAAKRIAGRVALGRGRLRDEEQLLSIVDQAAEQDLLEADDRDDGDQRPTRIRQPRQYPQVIQPHPLCAVA